MKGTMILHFVDDSKHIDICLQHYLRQKRGAAHDACLVMLIPTCKGRWSKYLGNFQRSKSMSEGSRIYSDTASNLPYPPLRRAMDLFVDKIQPTRYLSTVYRSANPLPMTFSVRIAGITCPVLVDTGASDNFIDSKLVKTLGLDDQLKISNGKVKCGGDTVAKIYASLDTTIMFRRGCKQKSGFFVTDLPEEHPLILGNTWIENSRAVLDHNKLEMRFQIKSRSFTLSCRGAHASKQGGQPVDSMLSYLQTFTAIDNGGLPVLFNLRATDAAEETQSPSLSDATQRILREYHSVFEDLPPGLPPTRGCSFTINTGDAPPVCGRAYRLTPKEKEQAETQIKDYLAKGWIRPSKSPYGAAILFVQKKDGSLRMCVDYRGLNRVTVKDKYPLPRIDDLVDKLYGATVFTSLDLQSGYHQIRIAEKDVHKTAFITPEGLYEYRVLPFGLCNAPSAFQRQMNSMFGHLPFAAVYLDDILVFSKTQEEHESHLRQVLSVLKENSFYAKLSKCSFYQTSTKFLGFVIDKDGIRMDPDKVSAVLNWSLPTSKTEVRSFLGLCNHYKRFIRDYSTKVAPLGDQAKADSSFDLDQNSDAIKVFEWLKRTITTAPVLAAPNFEAPFYVETDASGFGIGAVLLQEDLTDPSKPLRPLAYHSAKLSPAERNYPVGEQELLAVISALRKWRCYLEGAKGGVTIITDHLPNTFLDTKSTEQLSRRQARWQLELSRINPKWKYEKGQSNAADPLSRRPDLYCASAPQMQPICALHTVLDGSGPSRGDSPASKGPTGSHSPTTLSLHELESSADGPAILLTVSQQADPDGIDAILADIAEWYKSDSTNEHPLRESRSYTFRDGLWRYGELIYVPESEDLRRRCMAINHDVPSAGHPGRNITLELVQRHFWWPTIRRDVNQFVASCLSCQMNKATSQQPAGKLKPLDIPDYPWQSISMDLITKLPTTPRGHTAIIVFVDRLTKMVHFVPSHDGIGTREYAELFMREIFRRHGLPESIVSDRDPRFTSAFFKEICRQLGIKQSMSTAFHPQSDGQTERTNRTLEEMLRHYVDPTQDDWDLKLPCAEFAVNNAFKEATGHTPFYLNHGRHPRGPATAAIDCKVPAAHEFAGKVNVAITRAKDCLKAAQARMKRQADNHRRDLEFSVGDEVLLSSKNIRIRAQGTRKLLPRFIGPFTVLRRIGKMAYELELSKGMGRIHPVFHVSLLRPYQDDPRNPRPPVPTLIDGDDEYEVERVLDHRDVKVSQLSQRTRREFLVKWKGYGHEHNSWINHRDSENCLDLVQEYYNSKGMEP